MVPNNNLAGAEQERFLFWRLFFSFFRIGAFTIGGGYAMLPLIEREVVVGRRWLDEEQFLDTTAVAQSTPGVLAINMALYVGYRVAGLPGAAVAALGAGLPSFLIITAIATFLPRFREYAVVTSFFEGAQPAVVALLFGAAYSTGRKALKGRKQAMVAVAGLLAVLWLKLDPILVILAGGAAGAIWLKPGAEAGKQGGAKGAGSP